jgi:hypothetical protein
MGCIRIGLAQHTHAELYKTDMENISSNSFLSDFGSALRKSFHSACSILLAIRNDGMVLPMPIYNLKVVIAMYLITTNVIVRLEFS